MTAKRLNIYESFIILLLIGKIVVHYFIVHPDYDLQRDEYLHLDQANHLAWGFESVPPLTSWISTIIKWLGNSVFWVRFFPALFGAITAYVGVRIVKELGGEYFAQMLTTVALIFSVLLRVNMLYQPNTFDILCWSLAFYFVIRYVNRGESNNLYYLAIVLGLGFLNKYNIAFLLLSLLIALPFTRHRKLFANKHFYWAILLSLIIISPNLYWQYSNGWPVISHMNELSESQLVNVNRVDYLKDQVLFFFNSVFLLILAFIGFFFYDSFKQYRLVFLTFVFVHLFFILLRGKSYYSLGLFPVMLSFGSVYLEKRLSRGGLRKLRLVVPLAIIAFFIPFANVLLPLKSPSAIAENGELFKKLGLLRWEDGKEHALPQDFADMLGWEEMARKTETAFLQIPLAERKRAIIIADDYGQAAAINYYGKEFLPDAVSFNTDYINWFPPVKDQLHFIVVGDKSDQEDIDSFKKFLVVDSVTTKYARERGTGIYLLSYPDNQIMEKLRRRLRE